MKAKKNSEPRDEFDHIALPGFVVRPLENLRNRPIPTGAQPGTQTGARDDQPGSRSERPDTGHSPYGGPLDGRRPGNEQPYDPQAYGASSTDNDELGEDSEPARPVNTRWWAGPRGKIALYGAGTLIMILIQSRT